MSAKDPKGRKGEGKRAHSCGLTSDALQRGFDGEGGAQDVASHVAGCDPCGSALELLQTQRDAVQFLTASAAVTAPHTAVEQILAGSARAGREKLADLLYELAKACLIVLPNLKRRIERKVEPREVPVVSSELRSINSRLEKVDGAIALRDVPQQTPEETRALKVARSCLTILDNVEGASERQQLAWSQVLIFEGKPAEAEVALRQLLSNGISAGNQLHVLRNTMMSLNRQRRYAESVEFAETALHQCPNDCVLLYNLSVALASLRDLDNFKRASSRFARLDQKNVPEWLRHLVSIEAENFADRLSMSKTEVLEYFGLEPARGAVS